MNGKSKDEKILEIITVFSDITGKRLSAVGIRLYTEILSEYPIGKVEAAAKHLLKTRKWNTIPLPADFIEYLDPPEQAQIKANEAWRTVLYAIETHGYVTTVKFTDAVITQTILAMASSWPEFCNRTRCDDNEFKWLQKEFEQRYAGYAKMGTLRNQTLIGWIDAENGEANPQPVMIGEPERKLIAETQGDGG